MDRRGAKDAEKRGSTGRDVLCRAPLPLSTHTLVDHEAPHPLAFTHLWVVIGLVPVTLPPSPNLLNSSVSGKPWWGGGATVSHQA